MPASACSVQEATSQRDWERFGLRREAKRHAALAAAWSGGRPGKAVSPLSFATAVQKLSPRRRLMPASARRSLLLNSGSSTQRPTRSTTLGVSPHF